MGTQEPGDRPDREAYLQEQIARQQRGEPIDVEWVRSELIRVRQEAQQKLDSSRRRLRWLVVGMAVLFCVLWIANNVLNHRDPGLLVPIVVIVVLAGWSLYRRRK